jgi:hypothetical protein
MSISNGGFPDKLVDPNAGEKLFATKKERRDALLLKLKDHSKLGMQMQEELDILTAMLGNTDPLLMDAREFDALSFEDQFKFMNKGGRLY